MILKGCNINNDLITFNGTSTSTLNNMRRSDKVSLTSLNEHITCKLCKGYFIDATTIIECLHTFCKSCLVKYLATNKYCPECDVQVHKSKPLLNVRSDKTLQDIVYKLVPRLFQNEMQRRRDFYLSHHHNESKTADEKNERVGVLEMVGEPILSYHRHIFSPEETISVTLNYHGSNNKQLLRYLSCPAAVSIGHIHKLIAAKYDLNQNRCHGNVNSNKVEVLYNGNLLDSTLTLIDVAYIHSWNRKQPLDLTYRIYERKVKRIKFDQEETKEANDNQQQQNDVWNEVELRISESGEMSVLTTTRTTTRSDTVSRSTFHSNNNNNEENLGSTVVVETLRNNSGNKDSAASPANKADDSCKHDKSVARNTKRFHGDGDGVVNDSDRSIRVVDGCASDRRSGDKVVDATKATTGNNGAGVSTKTSNSDTIIFDIGFQDDGKNGCSGLTNITMTTTTTTAAINDGSCGNGQNKRTKLSLKKGNNDNREVGGGGGGGGLHEKIKGGDGRNDLDVEDCGPSEKKKLKMAPILSNMTTLNKVATTKKRKQTKPATMTAAAVVNAKKCKENDREGVSVTTVTATPVPANPSNTSSSLSPAHPPINLHSPSAPCVQASPSNSSSPAPSKVTTSPVATLQSPSKSASLLLSPKKSVGGGPTTSTVTTGGGGTTRQSDKRSVYKTLRDPPKTWNPQLPSRYITAPSSTPNSVSGSVAATATLPTNSGQQRQQMTPKFFKMRNNNNNNNKGNNVPRYLGNPASGVKPLYQLQKQQFQQTHQQQMKNKNTVAVIGESGKVVATKVGEREDGSSGTGTKKEETSENNNEKPEASPSNQPSVADDGKLRDPSNTEPEVGGSRGARRRCCQEKQSMKLELSNDSKNNKINNNNHSNINNNKSSNQAGNKKPDVCEIKKHSIVKIDPRTLKPIAERAPHGDSLSNNNSGSQQQQHTKNNSNSKSMTSMKINTSSVSIFNPIKLLQQQQQQHYHHSNQTLQHSPPATKMSMKNSNKTTNNHYNNNNVNSSGSNENNSSTASTTTTAPSNLNSKRDKINLTFTPSNPFVPNLTSPTLNPSPHHHLHNIQNLHPHHHHSPSSSSTSSTSPHSPHHSPHHPHHQHSPHSHPHPSHLHHSHHFLFPTLAIGVGGLNVGGGSATTATPGVGAPPFSPYDPRFMAAYHNYLYNNNNINANSSSNRLRIPYAPVAMSTMHQSAPCIATTTTTPPLSMTTTIPTQSAVTTRTTSPLTTTPPSNVSSTTTTATTSNIKHSDNNSASGGITSSCHSNNNSSSTNENASVRHSPSSTSAASISKTTGCSGGASLTMTTTGSTATTSTATVTTASLTMAPTSVATTTTTSPPVTRSTTSTLAPATKSMSAVQSNRKRLGTKRSRDGTKSEKSLETAVERLTLKKKRALESTSNNGNNENGNKKNNSKIKNKRMKKNEDGDEVAAAEVDGVEKDVDQGVDGEKMETETTLAEQKTKERGEKEKEEKERENRMDADIQKVEDEQQEDKREEVLPEQEQNEQKKCDDVRIRDVDGNGGKETNSSGGDEGDDRDRQKNVKGEGDEPTETQEQQLSKESEEKEKSDFIGGASEKVGETITNHEEGGVGGAARVEETEDEKGNEAKKGLECHAPKVGETEANDDGGDEKIDLKVDDDKISNNNNNDSSRGNSSSSGANDDDKNKKTTDTVEGRINQDK